MADFDREEWLSLAGSTDQTDQQLALELAKANAWELQEELLYWFACHTGFAERSAIYQLLLPEYRKNALALIDDKGGATPFDRTASIELFLRAEDLEMQKALVHLERWFMKPTDIKNALILEYKSQKGCTLEKAKVEVNRLYTQEPGHAGDDMHGGGRAPDDASF